MSSVTNEGLIWDFGTTVFVHWGNELRRSNDGGLTWANATPSLQNTPNRYAVIKNGDVYTIWSEVLSGTSLDLFEGAVSRLNTRVSGTTHIPKRAMGDAIRMGGWSNSLWRADSRGSYAALDTSESTFRALVLPGNDPWSAWIEDGGLHLDRGRISTSVTPRSTTRVSYTVYRYRQHVSDGSRIISTYVSESRSYYTPASGDATTGYETYLGTATRTRTETSGGTTVRETTTIRSGFVDAFDIAEDDQNGCYIGMKVNSTMEMRYRNAADTITTTKATLALPERDSDFWLAFLTAPGKLVCVATHGSDLKRRLYNPATNTWEGSWTTIVAGATNVTAISPSGSSRIRILVGSTLRSVSEQHAPHQPTWTTTVGGRNHLQQLILEWDFTDPDPLDTQGAYELRRVYGTTTEYWNGGTSSWQTGSHKNNGAGNSVTIPANWGVEGIAQTYAVRCWDNNDYGPSPWSDGLRIDPSTPSDPTITSPAEGAAVGALLQLAWYVTEQASYRVRLLGGTTASANTNVVYSDTGQTDDTTARTLDLALDTSRSVQWVELTTWNNEGLASTIRYRRLHVVPPDPVLPASIVAAVHNDYGEITIHASQPPPASTADAYATRIEVWRRPVGASGSGEIIGLIPAEGGWYTDRALVSGQEYEYRLRSVGQDHTVAWSDWTDGDLAEGSTPPSEPWNLALTVNDGEVTATWDPPFDTGGLPVPVYRVEWSHDGTQWASSLTDQGSTVIPGQRGTVFRLRVAGVNAAGQGRWASDSVPVGRGTLDAPSITGFSRSGNELTLSWAAPDGADGSTEYVVTTTQNPFPGGVWTERVVTGGQTTIQNVATGAWYARVKARDSRGGGPWSPIALAR